MFSVMNSLQLKNPPDLRSGVNGRFEKVSVLNKAYLKPLSNREDRMLQKALPL